MPRYFFDIHDGIDVHDDDGTELPGIEAARAHAISRAATYVSDLDGGGKGGFIVVIIRDAKSTLLTLRLVCQIDATGMSAESYLKAARQKQSRSI